MKLKAFEIFNKLINEEKVFPMQIHLPLFEFCNVEIVIKKGSTIESIMQEWLEGWLRHHGIDFAPNDNTQMPPDVFLDPQDKKHNLMEVKAFNYAANPGFDIADFRMYEQEIKEKPWMLDVDYLIFGYEMSKEGVVTVKNLWLKKVWEICRPMLSGRGKSQTLWPLNLQIKQNVVHKIRPAKWYGKVSKFKTFECLEDFLSAVEETVYKNKDTRDHGPSWLDGAIGNYEKFYGKRLRIPRWYDIESKYYVPNKKNKKD